MKNYLGSLVVALLGLFVASTAHAAITLPTSLAVTDMEAVASLMIIALAAIWVIRKVLGFFGR